MADASNPFGSPPPEGEDSFTFDNTPRQPKIEAPDGLYPLTLAEIRVEPNPFEPAKERRVWEFSIEGKEGRLFFYTSMAVGPRLQEVITALKVPYDATGKTRLKKSELIGRKCNGLVQNKPSKDGKSQFPRLKALLAMP